MENNSAVVICFFRSLLGARRRIALRVHGACTLLSVIHGKATPRRPGRRSIFSPATAREREQNFESYWLYQQRRDGEILEDAKDLSEKRKGLARFQASAVRTRRPVRDAIHRNYVTIADHPRRPDLQTR